jgi:hypothetical protein
MVARETNTTSLSRLCTEITPASKYPDHTPAVDRFMDVFDKLANDQLNELTK